MPKVRTAVVVLLLVLLMFPTWVRDRLDEVWENRPWDNEGAIALETPQLFTRGRLVNDRATESNWLEGQLQRTDDLIRENRFASPDFIKFARQRLAITLNGDGPAKPPTVAEDKDLVKRFADLGLKTQPIDQFEDAARYRAAIRNALMSTALDDRHDIEGNTIYRFNFNAAVVPPRGTRRLAAVTAVLTQAASTKDLPSVYVDILHDWRGRLQYQVQRHVEDRVNAIDNGQGFAAEDNRRFQKWLDAEMATLWNQLGSEPPPDFVNAFHRAYQYAALERQLLEVESIYRRIPALKPILSVSFPEKMGFLSNVLEQCRQTQNLYVPTQLVDQIDPRDMQSLRCPNQRSPLMEGVDLVDALTLVVENRSTLNSSCLRTEQLPSLLFHAATPPLPSATPSAGCKELGLSLYRAREARGIAKRRTDILAKFVANTLALERAPKSNVPIRLSDFFVIEVPQGCRDGSCIPVVELNTANNATAAKLATALLDAVSERANVFTYAVVPNKTVQRTEAAQRSTRETGLASLFGSLPLGTNVGADSEIYGAEKDPTVIGFGDSGASSSRPGTTMFGWAMFPKAVNGNGSKRHLAENYSVSALVSLPGWWKTAHLSVHTCWISESDLKNGVDCRKHSTRDPQQYTVRLPGDAGELMQSLRFEVLTYPYLDREQPAQTPVEVGRPASVVIRGGRLWRSPIVRLGAQQADRIEVLPDMQGIIARFDCVMPEPGTRGDGERRGKQSSASTEQQAADTYVLFRSIHVFTSEGGTKPISVAVRPFVARAGYAEATPPVVPKDGKTPFGKEDEPCWVKIEREAKEERDRKNFAIDQERAARAAQAASGGAGSTKAVSN